MKQDLRQLRRILRGYVRQAWTAYQESSAGEFIESENSLALYARYWKRLQQAARLLNCTVKQAADCLNISK